MSKQAGKQTKTQTNQQTSKYVNFLIAAYSIALNFIFYYLRIYVYNFH